MNYFANNFKDIIKRLEEHNEKQEKTISHLRERVRTFNEQDSLQELRSQVNYAYKHSLLSLTDKELQSMDTFINKHYHSKCHNGNHFIYDIEGTGLGACIKIKCPKCGESKDITDESKF